jgi:hypothetical protein
VPHFPRFRALALFRRRPPERVEGSSLPASENLHNCGPHASHLDEIVTRIAGVRMYP